VCSIKFHNMIGGVKMNAVTGSSNKMTPMRGFRSVSGDIYWISVFHLSEHPESYLSILSSWGEEKRVTSLPCDSQTLRGIAYYYEHGAWLNPYDSSYRLTRFDDVYGFESICDYLGLESDAIVDEFDERELEDEMRERSRLDREYRREYNRECQLMKKEGGCPSCVSSMCCYKCGKHRSPGCSSDDCYA
jgi:hypothetical protein